MDAIRSAMVTGAAGAMPLAGWSVRGAIIDTADVLYDATLWRRRLWQLINRLGVSADYASLFAGWERHYLVDVHRGRREYSEALQAFLLSVGLSWAQIDELEAASLLERRHLELGVRPFPGVVATLERLNRQGIALVAWADSPEPAARVATRIERLGLGSCFRAILSSFDVEAAQPEPVCYQAALDALGHAAADTVYVGHDPAHLAGAKAAGLRTAAFNFQPPAVADGYLTRFEDLLTLIEGDAAKLVRLPAATASTLRSRVALPAAPGHQR